MAKKSYSKKRTSPRRKTMKGGFIGNFLKSMFGSKEEEKPTAPAGPTGPAGPAPAGPAPAAPAGPAPAVPVPAEPNMAQKVTGKLNDAEGAINNLHANVKESVAKGIGSITDSIRDVQGKLAASITPTAAAAPAQTGGRRRHKHSRNCKYGGHNHGGSRKPKRSSRKRSSRKTKRSSRK